jgi:hypothetical protein
MKLRTAMVTPDTASAQTGMRTARRAGVSVGSSSSRRRQIRSTRSGVALFFSAAGSM